MKNILFLVFTSLLLAVTTSCKTVNSNMDQSTDFDFTAQWQKVDSLEQKQLPQSALEIVMRIKKVATNFGIEDQWVKAVLVENKFRVQLEEDGLVLAIERMELDLDQSTALANSILHSYLGELYQNYANQNQWQRREQQSAPDDESDLRRMSIAQLKALGDAHYLASISSNVLEGVQLDDIILLLEPKNELAQYQWSSLYDMLMHRAIYHFSGQGNFQKAPINAFQINDIKWMCTQSEFVRLTIEHIDSTSDVLRVLQLYQQVLAVHQMDSDPSVLVDFDLKRLAFVFQQLPGTMGKEPYEQQLQYLREKHHDHLVYAEITLQLCQIIRHQPTEGGSLLVDIHAMCTNAITRFPNSRGANGCQVMLDELEQKSLSVQIEQVVLPNKQILTRVDYRNIKEAFVRIVKLELEERFTTQHLNQIDQLQFLRKKAPVYQLTQSLADPQDYINHSTEWLLPALAPGYYAIMTSANEDYEMNGSAVAVQYFFSSALAFSHMQRRGASSFVCYERATGTPLQDLKVEWYTHRYDRSSRTSKPELVGSTRTDKDGMVGLDVARDQGVSILLSKGDDWIWLDNVFNNRNWRIPNHRQSSMQFFTDRAIYRPGQLIHFKGIALQSTVEDRPEIVSDRPIRVALYDANGQEVSSLELVTNEFGSLHGSFAAPSSGLLGMMSLGADFGNARQSIRVEAYKRPTFKAEMEQPSSDIEIGDSVIIVGSAKSYAGVPISGATVRYSVVRKARYPYYYHSYRFPQPQSAQREIANGMMVTNDQGGFTLTFEALADQSISPEAKPLFSYEIHADILDISGETQGSDLIVTVGYDPFQLKLRHQTTERLDQFTEIHIDAENYAGKPIEVVGELVLERLEAPSTWLRKRYWQRPDLGDLTSDQLEQGGYASNNRSMDDWRVIETYAPLDIAGNGSIDVSLTNLSLLPGYYRIKIKAASEQGRTVETSSSLTLYDPNASFVPQEALLFTDQQKDAWQPGDVATILVATPKAGYLLWAVDRKNQTSVDQWLEVDGWTTLTVPVQESDRGGLDVRLHFAYGNRVETQRIRVEVPWTNKTLQLSFTTSRDHVKPGAKETVTIEMSGAQTETALAEMVVSMYDQSLDAIQPHHWPQQFWPSFYSGQRWRTYGFNTVHSRLYTLDWNINHRRIDHTIYPTLNWYRFPRYMQQARGMMMKSSRAPNGAPPPPMMEMNEAVESVSMDADDLASSEESVVQQQAPIQVRENFDETVFFYPNLLVDTTGVVSFEYTMNDALTTWKMMAWAHTKGLSSGYASQSIVSQKELMLTTNRPRFFRAGDVMEFTAKVDNLTSLPLEGTATITIKNAIDGSDLSRILRHDESKTFELNAESSGTVSWYLELPKDLIAPLEIVMTARGAAHQDAERMIIPVLTNRTLVTESQVIQMRPKTTVTVDIPGLIDDHGSTTLQSNRFVIESVSDPSLFALKSLPYLRTNPHETTEGIFNRYFANLIGQQIVGQNPRLRTLHELWMDSGEIESPLGKDQALKSALLEETPWVRDAMAETEQAKSIAYYFNKNQVDQALEDNLSKLRDRQQADGSFCWFPGGRSNWYMTQLIVVGFGQLRQMGLGQEQPSMSNLVQRAIQYLDEDMKVAYRRLEERVKKGETKWDEDHLSARALQYLYARGFHATPIDEETSKIHGYYLDQIKAYWNGRSLYEQSLMTFILQRSGQKATLDALVASFNERLLPSESLGAHWNYSAGYVWTQRPIETHVMMMHVYDEIVNDQQVVNELKIWLLNQKRTTHWGNTKSTAAAIQALLMGSDNGGPVPRESVTVSTESETLTMDAVQVGQITNKWSFEGIAVQTDLATVTMENPNEQIAWGSVFWQYFEDLDKVKEETSNGPLVVERKLFKEVRGNAGVELVALEQGISVGDKIIVQLELIADRDMEFIHVKDLRAAALEPIQQLSGYQWQAGVGYYQSPTDLATHFFFDQMPRGTYVLQYALRVVQNGTFSNGICTIQSMYAPEFGSHTAGLTLQVAEMN